MNNRHLFLTSSGLSSNMKKMFFNIIGKDPDKVKILYIPTAGIKTDGAREGFALCLDELMKMGICYENIFIYNLELILSKNYNRTFSSHIESSVMVSRLLTVEEMKTFDAIFVSGGESTVLCKEMVRTGFDRVLTKAINNGLVYVGISAGSMYAGGNFDDGLNIIPNPIIPHGEGYKLVDLPNRKEEIQLADGQAVYIVNDDIRLI